MTTKQVCDYCKQENFVDFTKTAETDDFKIEFKLDICELCIKEFKKYLDKYYHIEHEKEDKSRTNNA